MRLIHGKQFTVSGLRNYKIVEQNFWAGLTKSISCFKKRMVDLITSPLSLSWVQCRFVLVILYVKLEIIHAQNKQSPICLESSLKWP